MTIKGVLLTVIVVALGLRCSSPTFRSCVPIGYHPCRSFMYYRNPEDTGLLWMYALYSSHKPKKLSRGEMLLRTRSLILILLLIGCVESHPGECLDFFIIYYVTQFGLNEKGLIKSYMYRYFVCLRPSFMNK